MAYSQAAKERESENKEGQYTKTEDGERQKERERKGEISLIEFSASFSMNKASTLGTPTISMLLSRKNQTLIKV